MPGTRMGPTTPLKQNMWKVERRIDLSSFLLAEDIALLPGLKEYHTQITSLPPRKIPRGKSQNAAAIQGNQRTTTVIARVPRFIIQEKGFSISAIPTSFHFHRLIAPMAVTRLMVSAAPPQAANLRTFEFGGLSSVKLSFTRFSSPNKPSTVVNMAPQKKVNKYDPKWEKQWYGAGIFVEGSEDVEVDVFKKLEEKKVLSNVEKSGLLSKAEDLGFTLSSIEKLGFLSKAEELGLLSLVEKAASLSPSTLASLSLPLFVTALVVIVVIPDDSAPLVVLQTAFSGALGIGAAGFLVMSVLLDGLQEAD